jgi:uncharacterized damage-inducible protein DinB
MAMSLDDALARFAANRDTIRGLVAAISSEQAGWRPAPGAWSMLEVINHLADEESEDFRTRLDHTLHRPEVDWPPIDPQAWIRERDYALREPDESLARFEAERESSLSWLRALESPDWDSTHHHPIFPPIKAGDLLHAWLAHDLLHIRQLVELHHGWLCAQATPYEPGYAGDW